MEESRQKVLQKFWKEPDSTTDQHVRDYIKRVDTQKNAQKSSNDEHHSSWESSPNPLCAASFGDGGMTATVNAYGLLMQFGDYLGVGRSGLFSADHDFVPEHSLFNSRARVLDNMIKAPSLRHESYGLSLGGLSLKPDQPPRLSWKQWRWPCYKYDPEQFYDPRSSLTIDWMVHENTLLHRCILETSANDQIAIRFLKHLRIRDLDHVGGKSRSKSNKHGIGFLESGTGPGRCSWIWRVPYIPLRTDQKAVGRKDPEQETTADVKGEETGQKPGGQNSDEGRSDTRRQPMKVQLGYFQHEGVEPPKISITEPSEIKDPNALADERGANIEEATNEPRVVVVVAAVFVNGEPKQFEIDQDGSSPQVWTEELRKGARDTTNGTRKLEIITAYRMFLQPLSDVKWQDLIIKAQEIDMDRFIEKNTLRPEYLPSIGGHIAIPKISSTNNDYETKIHKGQDGLDVSNISRDHASGITLSPSKVKHLTGTPRANASPSEHIEYLIWRNLEHILSVCSIPMGSKRDGGMQPVALTCGDMSMHRICTSTSYFAIQFLIEVSKRLEKSNDKSGIVKSLQERIRKVCLGHIQWLISSDKLESGEMAANYWVTGKIYPSVNDSFSWQAPERVVDAPFQIMKATEVLSFYTREQTARNLCEKLLKQICIPWLQGLQDTDQRIKFAWPHAVEEGINTFRLDDHVWIWRALKALQDLNLLEEWSYISERRQLSITDIQREILQRFTMKNDDSGKRMLAVTRSVREHRFLFHARDTALYYGLDFFLQSTSSRELWENTIQAQAQHEDNEEMTWQNAIRYALTIVMGTHDSRVNSSKSATEQVRAAVQSLLGITSSNGFFPGQLRESADGKPVPALFSGERNREFYFHAHFEVSYIFLLNFDSICQKCLERIPEPKENAQQGLTPKELSRLGHNLENQLEKISIDLASLAERMMIQQEHNMSNEKQDRKTGTAMKKIFPFGSSVDSSKIVEIDDEWLFNYPAFFAKQQLPLPDFAEISTVIKKAKRRLSGDIVSRQLEYNADDDKPFGTQKPLGWLVAVTNVPKQKHVSKMGNKQRPIYPKISSDKRELWNTLKKPRKAEDAKKRVVWLREPDAETAVVCYLTTHIVYQASLSLFFDRHSKRVTHFSDETSKIYNEWQTELLFSFYLLADNNSTTSQRASKPSSSGKNFPTVQGRIPVRACLGFRWPTRSESEVASAARGMRFALQHERDWKQRKVLELFFIGRMVDITLQSTEMIVDNLKIELDRATVSFAHSSSEKYLANTHNQLQRQRNLLESIDSSLSNILDVMNMWDTRERDRAQQPRWTRNDERKYRESINNLRGSIERKFTDFKGLKLDARALKEKFDFTLSTNIAKISENRSTSKEENLRLFTYVTVVFLPLGFAASIFSMAGTPDVPLVFDMIVCAIIALILTVVMLLNAQSLASIAREASRAMHVYSRRKMEESQLAKYRAAKHVQSGRKKHKMAFKAEHDEKSWYLLFWVVYILVEFPARQVFVACRVLVSSNHGKQDEEAETTRTKGPLAEQRNEEVSKESGKSVAAPPTSIVGSTMRIFGGLIFSPMFVITWIIQVVICNVWDLLRLIHGTLPSMTSLSGTTTNGPNETHPDIWFKPGKRWRPIRELDQYLMQRKVSNVGKVKSGDGEDPSDGQVSEKTEVIEKSKSA
ncbi:hypothetical protein G7054_g12613 [Neopestalotiopsis clavispora]|nr:hypothetical protein G7054_g12613 [Neopestalotiopsis clavispora]